MATVQIPWGDGTSDKVTVTYTGATGSSQPTIASAPNTTGSARTITVSFKTASGIALATLTIKQDARSRAYSVAYSAAYQ